MKCSITWHLMHELNMRSEAGNHDDIDGSRAHCLISDIDVTAESVTRLRQQGISNRGPLCGPPIVLGVPNDRTSTNILRGPFRGHSRPARARTTSGYHCF